MNIPETQKNVHRGRLRPHRAQRLPRPTQRLIFMVCLQACHAVQRPLRPPATTSGWVASEQTAARTTRSAQCKRTETHRRREGSARTPARPARSLAALARTAPNAASFTSGASPVPLGGLGSAGKRGAHRHSASSCYRLSPRPTARSPPPLIAAAWPGPPRYLLTWRLPADPLPAPMPCLP